ncbi:MAG TPA: EI24 domain-containing protein [Burkholderiaceae bacterium]|nr:EI24 domain-containing protein [Burkholderiaceae bacterium]
MNLLIDSFWRAAAYCLHPRVILISLLPLLITGVLAGVLGYFYWGDAVQLVRSQLEAWAITSTALDWLSSMGLGAFRAVLAPLVVLAVVVPLIVIVSLLIVAASMSPTIVRLVATRRFPALERLHGGSTLGSIVVSLTATVVAVIALIVSIPLWLVPPLVLVLPPLIWGWLTYRVMSFDALAEHASRDERRELIRTHRLPLLSIGVVTGYLGAAPAMVWAVSAAMLVFAPILIVVSIWLYTLVFAFSSLWFTHYGLSALARLRAERGQTPPAEPVEPGLAPGEPSTVPSMHGVLPPP